MEDYIVNLSEWIARFPLVDANEERARDPVNWYGGTVNSPQALARIEQIRRYVESKCDLGLRIPADVFLFARGEPQRRDLTKVGGLPYRPASLTWPSTSNKGPMKFIAQFRFTESKDIIPDLPGDILLIFATERGLYTDREEPRYFHFEWHPLGLSDLIQPSEIPRWSLSKGNKDFYDKMRAQLSQSFPEVAAKLPVETGNEPWEIPTCYGLKHRTWDYLDENSGLQKLEKHIPSFHSVPLAQRRNTYGSLLRLKGWKIGGLPFWIDPPNPSENIGGRHLCTLTEIQPITDTAFPWANVPEPLPFDESGREPKLAWYDTCYVNFTIDDAGTVDWALQVE